jgi:hypothetical protein
MEGNPLTRFYSCQPMVNAGLCGLAETTGMVERLDIAHHLFCRRWWSCVC